LILPVIPLVGLMLPTGIAYWTTQLRPVINTAHELVGS